MEHEHIRAGRQETAVGIDRRFQLKHRRLLLAGYSQYWEPAQTLTRLITSAFFFVVH